MHHKVDFFLASTHHKLPVACSFDVLSLPSLLDEPKVKCVVITDEQQVTFFAERYNKQFGCLPDFPVE